MVVLGGKFILLLFIEVNGCLLLVGVERWLLLGGLDVLIYVEINRGHLVCLLQRGWLLFVGGVNRGLTVNLLYESSCTTWNKFKVMQ